MQFLTLTLRSGHRLHLRSSALLGFYPDVSEGTRLITASPHDIAVEEEPEKILSLLQDRPENISDTDEELLR
jgi:hypothetical protein